jgi:predicted MPP superfamily phosphohydrolase
MILMLLIVCGAVIGWLYILCRVMNRVAALADRIVRLSLVGLAVMCAAPVAFVALMWIALPCARGWWGIDCAVIARNHVLLTVIATGWAALVIELVRRRVAAYVRFPAIASRVVFHPVVVENVRHLIRWRCPVCNALSAACARIPLNRLGDLHLFSYDVKFPGLPPQLDGVRIVHLSDLHHSPDLDDGFFRRIVEKVNTLDADVVALTGDFIHSCSDARAVAALLAPLRARHGVFFVCGNHDIWHGEKELVRAFHDVGFVHVAGRAAAVEINGAVLHVAGSERPWRKDYAADRLDVLPSGAFCLALSHHPDNVRWLRRHRVAFMLSGHTHGGQIALPGLGPLLVPSAYGSHHAIGFVPAGDTLLYVNYGLALSLPLRLLCPPEIACFTLRQGGGGI